MTAEISHGKLRVLRPRPRDAGTGPTAEERRRRDHGQDGRFRPGNRAAAERGARSVLERPERALAAIVGKLAQSLSEPSERAEVLRDVRVLYRATLRALGSNSVIVAASCATFAREQVLGGLFYARAVDAGVTTDQGARFMEAAHKCEQRAERAMLHARVMAEQLRSKATAGDAPWFEPAAGDGTDDEGGS